MISFWDEDESESLLIALKFGLVVRAMTKLPDVSKARILFHIFFQALMIHSHILGGPWHRNQWYNLNFFEPFNC